MQESLRDLVSRRRNRAIATILRVKEDLCDYHLPINASNALRKVVLDEINDLCDLVLDVFETIDDHTTIMNDLWLKKLDDIHRAVAFDEADITI
jgi:hypothetical protein